MMEITYHAPLSASDQARLGITPPAPLAMADRVRFAELDVLKHVNNAVYLQWFERVRVRYAQQIGLSQDLGGDTAPRIVIRSGTIHYRQEMRMDEDYVVTCGCTAFRNTSFSMHQELWSNHTLRATFDCVLVLLRPGSAGRFPIPDDVRKRFAEHDRAIFEG